jgi:hypothetical protein
MPSSKLTRSIINRSVLEGRIPESRRDHYERLYDAAPAETLDLLAQLPRGAALASAAPAAPDAEDYPTQGLTAEERERIAAAQAGSPPPRIVSEPGGRS